jgi:hypothetical protein
MAEAIPSPQVYHKTMVDIYELMNKGEANLTDTELTLLAQLSTAAEVYEDTVMGLKPIAPQQQ